MSDIGSVLAVVDARPMGAECVTAAPFTFIGRQTVWLFANPGRIFSGENRKLGTMRRAPVAAAAVLVWAVSFLVVRNATAVNYRPCRDVILMEVNAACALPGPGLLPAIPVATAIAPTFGMSAIWWLRRRA